VESVIAHRLNGDPGPFLRAIYKMACNVGQITCLCALSEELARGPKTAAGFFNRGISARNSAMRSVRPKNI
jgi:hypothetical protein